MRHNHENTPVSGVDYNWPHWNDRVSNQRIPLVLGYIDFEQAFDSIYPKVVLEVQVLNGQGMEHTYVETQANIYKEATGKVKIHEGTAEFNTGRGVH